MPSVCTADHMYSSPAQATKRSTNEDSKWLQLLYPRAAAIHHYFEVEKDKLRNKAKQLISFFITLQLFSFWKSRLTSRPIKRGGRKVDSGDIVCMDEVRSDCLDILHSLPSLWLKHQPKAPLSPRTEPSLTPIQAWPVCRQWGVVYRSWWRVTCSRSVASHGDSSWRNASRVLEGIVGYCVTTGTVRPIDHPTPVWVTETGRLVLDSSCVFPSDWEEYLMCYLGWIRNKPNGWLSRSSSTTGSWYVIQLYWSCSGG
jgi:hypothetical protein